MAGACIGLFMRVLLGVITPLAMSLKATLTSHTSSVVKGGAGTAGDIYVSYKVDGKYTPAEILTHGSARGQTDSLSTDLQGMPTRVHLTLSGDDGWALDLLTLTMNGKTCSLMAGPMWLDGNNARGFHGTKEFDVVSACPDLGNGLMTLTSHTATSPAGAGTNSKVFVSYEIQGSYTEPITLCDGGPKCHPGETASASRFSTAMPTKVGMELVGDDDWLFDTLVLTMSGNTCNLGSGNHMFMNGGAKNTFDVFSLCPELYVRTTFTSHTSSDPSYAGTLDDIVISYEVDGMFTSPAVLAHGSRSGQTDSLTTYFPVRPTKVTLQNKGKDNWLFDSIKLTMNGEMCSLVSGPTWLDGDEIESMYGEETFDVVAACGTPTPATFSMLSSRVSTVAFSSVAAIAALSSVAAFASIVHKAVFSRNVHKAPALLG